MEYDCVHFDNYDLIGTIGTCGYCGGPISECCEYEKTVRDIVHSNCFVWYCYDRGIKCKITKNVVEI